MFEFGLLHQRLPRIPVLHRKKNPGKGGSCRGSAAGESRMGGAYPVALRLEQQRCSGLLISTFRRK